MVNGLLISGFSYFWCLKGLFYFFLSVVVLIEARFLVSMLVFCVRHNSSLSDFPCCQVSFLFFTSPHASSKFFL